MNRTSAALLLTLASLAGGLVGCSRSVEPDLDTQGTEATLSTTPGRTRLRGTCTTAGTHGKTTSFELDGGTSTSVYLATVGGKMFTAGIAVGGWPDYAVTMQSAVTTLWAADGDVTQEVTRPVVALGDTIEFK